MYIFDHPIIFIVVLVSFLGYTDLDCLQNACPVNVLYSLMYMPFFYRNLNHKNLVKLMGVSLGKPIYIVTEFCGKVSAQFKYSIFVVWSPLSLQFM